MASCLGLFVEENLIKYARISKEKDNIKIENYGMKFYEQDTEKTIKQIIDETYSYTTPISINIVNEKYTNAEVFDLLSDIDKKKSIKTQFEYFCNDTGKNKLTLDYRTVISNGTENNDKKNVLFTYVDKGNIAERIQLLDSYRIINVSPVSLAMQSLQKDNKANTIIINIEDRTEVTTLINNVPAKVDIIENGMTDILKQIAERENSFTKAYEICKNTTLYTTSGLDLKSENNDYLEIIIPTIYKIIEEVKKIIATNNIEIEKIYITGTAVAINNIDLYFQENFLNYKCEILTPYFIDKTNLRINIKDYIEVNSAIALAVQALSKGHKDFDFNSKLETRQKIYDILHSDIGSFTKKKKSEKVKNTQKKPVKLNFKFIVCIRFLYSMFCFFAIYIIATFFISKNINSKIQMAQETIDDTVTKTQKLDTNLKLITDRTNDYQEILNQMQEENDKSILAKSKKNAITNLLNQIMFATPKEAQIVLIQNTDEKHIAIEVQAEYYQYLGYFKAEIQNKTILTNVTSTAGTKVTVTTKISEKEVIKKELIKVTIEGDLPY